MGVAKIVEVNCLHGPADPVASSASKLWAERPNATRWQTSTRLGDWVTEDRITWRTADGRWLAHIQRRATLRTVSFLALWAGVGRTVGGARA